MDTKKKKNKSGKFIIIILIIVALSLFVFLKLSSISELNDELTLSEKIWLTIIGLPAFGLIILFIITPKKIKVPVVAWVQEIFILIIWPSLFLIILLLGVLDTLYPASYYPNGTFEDNLNKTFTISGHSLSKSFSKISMTIFDTGRSHPYIVIIFSLIYMTFALFTIKRNVDESILNEKNAEELLNSITSKDYHDLEKYEVKLRNKRKR